FRGISIDEEQFTIPLLECKILIEGHSPEEKEGRRGTPKIKSGPRMDKRPSCGFWLTRKIQPGKGRCVFSVQHQGLVS
ncbi:MAG: hypothetical protein KKE57_03000, partial [Proteobacteria bacterium]|nr:hypothetical protein [Pseudomonadota bacterium]